MKTEDYSRAVRAMNEVLPDDRAAITLILHADGGVFFSHTGETEDIVTLMGCYAFYCESVADQLKGGEK